MTVPEDLIEYDTETSSDVLAYSSNFSSVDPIYRLRETNDIDFNNFGNGDNYSNGGGFSTSDYSSNNDGSVDGSTARSHAPPGTTDYVPNPSTNPAATTNPSTNPAATTNPSTNPAATTNPPTPSTDLQTPAGTTGDGGAGDNGFNGAAGGDGDNGDGDNGEDGVDFDKDGSPPAAVNNVEEIEDEDEEVFWQKFADQISFSETVTRKLYMCMYVCDFEKKRGNSL